MQNIELLALRKGGALVNCRLMLHGLFASCRLEAGAGHMSERQHPRVHKNARNAINL